MDRSLLHGLKRRAGAVLLVALLALGGFLVGRASGAWLVRGLLLRESRFPLLLSRPVYQFYDIHALLNSPDPLSRLSGYYSLVDTSMIDDGFIRERYVREQVPVIRRTLLWILGLSGDRASALRTFAALYPESDDAMKREILSMMEALDPAFSAEFRKKNRVPGAGRPGR